MELRICFGGRNGRACFESDCRVALGVPVQVCFKRPQAMLFQSELGRFSPRYGCLAPRKCGEFV